MSELEAARDRFVSRFPAFRAQAARGEPAWLGALREEALRSFGELGFPTTRMEAWRHTNLAPLARVPFEPPAADDARVSRDEVEAHSFPFFACSAFVFLDGRYAPELSTPTGFAGEVGFHSLAQLRAEAPERLEAQLGRLASSKEHAFVALNTAFVDDGAVLLLAPGLTLEQPIHLVFAATGAQPATVCHPRVLIAAGAGSRATVIQDHVSLGDATTLTNAVTEVAVGDDAALELVLLQREAPASFHLSHLACRQERNSRLRTHTLTLGGALVRNDLVATLAEEGAECTLNGLFAGRDRQLIDNHTLVDHAMPHGSSRELYKGILDERARGVFRGRVIVRPDAQKTDARQSNPNLLLGGRAEIDTKPQLEIHADDVKCSHGSSIGNLDPDALFYLRCRGITEPRARELLTRAFAAEILDALPVPALAESLAESLLSGVLGGAAEERR